LLSLLTGHEAFGTLAAPVGLHARLAIDHLQRAKQMTTVTAVGRSPSGFALRHFGIGHGCLQNLS